EPLWLRTMGRVLAREGFGALLLDDAAEALARIPEERPSVAIIDGQMPGQSGVELAPRLRATMGEACPTLLLVSGDPESLEHEPDRFAAVYGEPVPLELPVTVLRREATAASAWAASLNRGSRAGAGASARRSPSGCGARGRSNRPCRAGD